MNSRLNVTLIDVGWGDSILVETWSKNDRHRYALIDSNDTPTLRSSYIFLRHFFERSHALRNTPLPATRKRIFDWVLLTHAHADHAQGLKRILQEFGTRRFLYPNTPVFRAGGAKSYEGRPAYVGSLMRFVRNSKKVGGYGPVDTQTTWRKFGPAYASVLWPPRGHASHNENDNSVVVCLTLGKVSFVLTGDAEATAWNSKDTLTGLRLSERIPPTTRFFKVPHHGADNGMFEPGRRKPATWLNRLPARTSLGISSHVQPFSHPHPAVIREIERKGMKCYRTDQHFHVTVSTDGKDMWVTYSH